GLAAMIKDSPMPTSNTTAVALDGLVRYSPPTASQLGFAGEYHYAPQILTFGDAVRYAEVDVRIEYELAPQTLVYVGYRRITFGIKNAPAVVVDNGGLIGFKLAF
ncbi:MAG TPA: YfaZ family outer membrane protein, partial [Gallionellaceae bacterium]|nr:YfaZ family outer membrane protein [Gallionellaceae bacterium]